MSINNQNKKCFCAAWLTPGIVVVILCCLLLACPAIAGTAWQQKQKLTAVDGAALDEFGYSVSISGDYAIIGAAYEDNEKGTDPGSAYIFRWDGISWVRQQKLTPSDGAAHDYFGCSIFISGDYAIVGAYYGDGNVTNSGSAYIFWWDGTNWVQQQKLTASDGAVNDYFGCSVSISGDYAIIGALGDDDRGNTSGSVYIFTWDGTGWIQQQKLTASDGVAWDYFGYSVSISGDYAIIGAILDDDMGTNSGSAYIFWRDGTNWIQQQKLTASDGAAYDHFSNSVSMSGDYAIIGADQSPMGGTGKAYIFNRDGTGWVLQQKLTASDGAASDFFGGSVSINGDFAVIGAYKDDDNGYDSGSAYIFWWNGTGWVLQQKLTASDGVAYDLFGCSVSISGDYAIVGAFFGNGNEPNSGSAYIFEFTPPSLALLTPNGGENLAEGSTYDITWDTNNVIENVFIEYSDNNSLDWMPINTVVNTGSYQWLVPDVNSSQCLVRISNVSNPDVNDSSNNVFRIYVCADWLTADLYCDCFVDFKDFSILGNQWLQAPGYPSADLAPEGGDGVVNLLDLGVLVDQWLKCGDPCDPNCQP